MLEFPSGVFKVWKVLDVQTAQLCSKVQSNVLIKAYICKIITVETRYFHTSNIKTQMGFFFLSV